MNCKEEREIIRKEIETGNEGKQMIKIYDNGKKRKDIDT